MTHPPIIIVTGPSGAGKSTVVDAILANVGARFPRPGGVTPPLRKFVTCTTRPRRPGEKNGRDYHFMTRKKFEQDIKDGWFFEHAEVYGNLYGSSRRVMEKLFKGKSPIIGVLDVQGAKTVKRVIPEAFIIFIDAPKKSLVTRLKDRKTDAEELKRRIAKMEMEKKLKKSFDIAIMNPDGKIKETLKKVEAAIKRIVK
ncbi:guanylate kinase [Candidatus Uhrbacteria bacterium]|nr:guanylate kinase [Candidatus Uhrbacteria bacterium]